MYERFRYVSEDLLSAYDRFGSFVKRNFKTPCKNAVKGKVGEDYVVFQNVYEALLKASEAFLKAYEAVIQAYEPYLTASQAFRKACRKFLKRF